MTTATCDLNVDWNKCPNCARLKERIEDAEKAAKAVSANLDRAYAGYRFERDAGRAVIYTSQWRAWQDRIDNLEQALDAAHATCTAALDEWAASIHAHRRLHEERQQEATGETEEMVTISKADAVDELVNIYGGHIDKWLEALRERTGAQTDADDDAEAAETEEMPTFLQDDEPTIKEDKLARELFGKLWYSDVPEPALPKSFSELSPMTLAHCARAIGLYLRLLENHAPAFTDGYPTWVAHRLIDAFDDAAETREAALAAKEGEER